MYQTTGGFEGGLMPKETGEKHVLGLYKTIIVRIFGFKVAEIIFFK